MAKIDEADAAVARLENEPITNKQRRNSFGAGGPIAVNKAGAVLARLSANPMAISPPV